MIFVSGSAVGKGCGASLVGVASLATVLGVSKRAVAGVGENVGVSPRTGDWLIGVPSLRFCMAALKVPPSLRTGAPAKGVVVLSGVTSLRAAVDKGAAMV